MKTDVHVSRENKQTKKADFTRTKRNENQNAWKKK